MFQMSELTEQFLALSVSSPLIPSLPDNVTIDIVARVPVSHYPTLSLTFTAGLQAALQTSVTTALQTALHENRIQQAAQGANPQNQRNQQEAREEESEDEVQLRTAYDPKQRCWSVVNGLQDFLVAETAGSFRSRTVNYGAKRLALFFSKKHDGNDTIFCAEIALERRQGGEIRGKLDSCDGVIEDVGPFHLVKFVSVTV
ncbi:hypothetical protein HID58_084338 [Brassica napus]|uniref:Uncharacterized protein n=1 Tax=Brassica napus TaxID=3708 RepID=A0ABQ7XLE6_BRANA|nr:hypothetical protein HID58_084338 [Brassica napus]